MSEKDLRADKWIDLQIAIEYIDDMIGEVIWEYSAALVKTHKPKKEDLKRLLAGYNPCAEARLIESMIDDIETAEYEAEESSLLAGDVAECAAASPTVPATPKSIDV